MSLMSSRNKPEPKYRAGDFLSLKETAELLRIDVKTVRRYAAQGKFRLVALNPEAQRATSLILRSSLEAYLDNLLEQAAGQTAKVHKHLP